jgi:UDP-galactopyranose mutase
MDNVTFVGRLATYKYYNMDQVVGQALAAFKRLQRRHEQALERSLGAESTLARAELSTSS